MSEATRTKHAEKKCMLTGRLDVTLTVLTGPKTPNQIQKQ